MASSNSVNDVYYKYSRISYLFLGLFIIKLYPLPNLLRNS